jgi:inner membrane protein
MMWHTHAAIGASATWLLVPFVLPDNSAIIAVLMVFCVVGAMVPDLDAVESKIKHVKVINIKPLVPVSRAINRQFGHRGMLHSLRGWLIWTVLIFPWSAAVGWLPVDALSLGYASHLVGDACTRTAIPLFYPQRKNYHLLPIRIRVVTGSEYEELFFVVFAMLSVCLLMTRLTVFGS